MKKAPKIDLSKEKRDLAIKEIVKYFENERDEEIGDLQSALILDFIIEKIGPAIYNQGLYDAIALLQEKTEDLYSLEITGH